MVQAVASLTTVILMTVEVSFTIVKCLQYRPQNFKAEKQRKGSWKIQKLSGYNKYLWRHDTQQNDIRYNDPQNTILKFDHQHNGIKYFCCVSKFSTFMQCVAMQNVVIQNVVMSHLYF